MLVRVNTHRTSPILSRRALLLAPLLTACSRTVTQQRVDPALAPLIPPDTTTLVGVRLDNLRRTPAWEILFPRDGSIALEQLRIQTGIDLTKGIYEVVYCLGGKSRAALIRGKFVDGGIANSGLEPQLLLEGAQKFPYKGFSFVGQESFAVTFFNSSVAVAGPAASLRSIIDNRELRNGIPRDLINLVGALPASSHFYLASLAPRLPEGGLAGIKSLPLALRQFTAWLDMTTGAAFHAEATGESPADAQRLAEALRAAQGLFRLTLKGEQKDLLDRLHFHQQDNLVKLEADLPLPLLKDLLQSFDLMA